MEQSLSHRFERRTAEYQQYLTVPDQLQVIDRDVRVQRDSSRDSAPAGSTSLVARAPFRQADSSSGPFVGGAPCLQCGQPTTLGQSSHSWRTPGSCRPARVARRSWPSRRSRHRPAVRKPQFNTRYQTSPSPCSRPRSQAPRSSPLYQGHVYRQLVGERFSRVCRIRVAVEGVHIAGDGPGQRR